MEVTAGLEDGDVVITNPHEALADGAKVVGAPGVRR
jgi:hypothetical protein